MRFGLSATVLLAIAIMQPACGPSGSIVTMTGESVTVQLHGGSREEAELLAVEDSAILCLVHDRSLEAEKRCGCRCCEENPAQSLLPSRCRASETTIGGSVSCCSRSSLRLALE